MRRIAVCAVLVTAGTSGSVAAANDIRIDPVRVPATVLAPAPGATALTAYAGHVVWSVYDPATRRWALVQWYRGQLSRLPVPERAVPFDANAGPSALGKPVVVFSRCRRDPTDLSGIFPSPDWGTATGCRIMQVPLTGGSPVALRRILGGRRSLTTPAVWRGAVAAVERRRGGDGARILLWRPGAANPVRLRGGSVPTCQFPSCAPHSLRVSVDALDLGPRSLAHLWRITGASSGTGVSWELRTVSRATGRSVIAQFGYISGACGFRQPFAPQAFGLSALYVDAGSPCEELQTAIARFDPRSERRREARPADGWVYGLARDGANTYWLRAHKRADSTADYEPSGIPCVGETCELVRSRDLPYRPGRQGASHPAT